MEVFVLEVHIGFKGCVMFSLTLAVLFAKLAAQIGGIDCTRKTLFVHYASGVGDFMQSLSSFVISWMVSCTLMPR